MATTHYPLWPDRLMSRLLFVGAPASEDAATSTRRAERAFGLSLVFSAVRCTLQYVIFPFVLPLLGLATDAAAQINLVISLLAVVAIITSLRRFWRVRYQYRWQYLAMALVMLAVIAVFIQVDLAAITAP